jgi:hypothetical protein
MEEGEVPKLSSKDLADGATIVFAAAGEYPFVNHLEARLGGGWKCNEE